MLAVQNQRCEPYLGFSSYYRRDVPTSALLKKLKFTIERSSQQRTHLYKPCPPAPPPHTPPPLCPPSPPIVKGLRRATNLSLSPPPRPLPLRPPHQPPHPSPFPFPALPLPLSSPPPPHPPLPFHGPLLTFPYPTPRARSAIVPVRAPPAEISIEPQASFSFSSCLIPPSSTPPHVDAAHPNTPPRQRNPGVCVVLSVPVGKLGEVL